MKQTSVWSPADLFPSPSTSSSVCWKLHPARHLMFLSSFFYYFILLRLNLFHVSPPFVEFTSFILREPPPPPPPPTFKLYSQFFCGFYSLHVLLNVHIVGHRGQCSLSKLPPLLLSSSSSSLSVLHDLVLFSRWCLFCIRILYWS